jgi:hypothetical protein
MTQRYHPYDPSDPKPATMYPHAEGAWVMWHEYFQLLQDNYRKGMEVWKSVVSTDVYQDLKFGKFRDILNLLADGEISVGKCAQSIVERAGGLEPRLPKPTLESDLSWKEQYDEAEKRIEQLENVKASLIASVQSLNNANRDLRNALEVERDMNA